MTRTLLTIVLTVVIVFLSCQKNDGGPCITCPLPLKDPRTYTWVAETLAYPGSFQTMMGSMWAESGENIYIVGHNDQNRGMMYHYDGNVWSNTKVTVTEGGNIDGAIDFNSVFGFGPANIIAVGERLYLNNSPPPNILDSSLIIQFDGSLWSEAPLRPGRALQTVWGKDPSNIWVGGWEGTLYHFDGQSWQRDSLPINPPIGWSLSVNSISGTSSDNVSMLASMRDTSTGATKQYFLQRTANTWAAVDSFDESGTFKFGEVRSWASPWGVLYSAGNGVFEWDGTSWKKIFSQNVNESGCRIFGSANDNIFVTTFQGSLYHFNGIDWFQYQNLAIQSYFADGWTDGKEVFITGWTQNDTPTKTIILHGK